MHFDYLGQTPCTAHLLNTNKQANVQTNTIRTWLLTYYLAVINFLHAQWISVDYMHVCKGLTFSVISGQYIIF